MVTFRFRMRTGPTLVGQLAEKLMAAGLEIIAQGTEAVLVDYVHRGPAKAAAWDLLVDVRRRHGRDFGLQPVLVKCTRDKEQR